MKRKKEQQYNPKTIARKIAKGHGQGEGASYIPWIDVRSFSSRGLVHRLKSWKCGGREIHLFSYLEFCVALLLDWRDDVVTYYEQFPLHSIEETTTIANSLGVKPPRYHGKAIVMTSDFRIRLRNSFEAYSVKPAALVTERVLQKFLIEKTYWAKRNALCRMLTDDQLPRALIESIIKIHQYYSLEDFKELTPEIVGQAEITLREALVGKSVMLDAAKHVETTLNLPAEDGLVLLKHLFANKVFPLDPLQILDFSQPLFTLWPR